MRARRAQFVSQEPCNMPPTLSPLPHCPSPSSAGPRPRQGLTCGPHEGLSVAVDPVPRRPHGEGVQAPSFHCAHCDPGIQGVLGPSGNPALQGPGDPVGVGRLIWALGSCPAQGDGAGGLGPDPETCHCVGDWQEEQRQSGLHAPRPQGPQQSCPCSLRRQLVGKHFLALAG